MLEQAENWRWSGWRSSNACNEFVLAVWIEEICDFDEMSSDLHLYIIPKSDIPNTKSHLLQHAGHACQRLLDILDRVGVGEAQIALAISSESRSRQQGHAPFLQ